jgi:hypothetical protein
MKPKVVAFEFWKSKKNIHMNVNLTVIANGEDLTELVKNLEKAAHK